MATLTKFLLSENRIEDLKRASEDADFRNKLQVMLEKVVELAEQITDEEQRTFTLSGTEAICGRFVQKD